MSPTETRDRSTVEVVTSRLRSRCGRASRIRERAAEVNDPVLEPLRTAMARRASELELEAFLYSVMLEALEQESATAA